MTERTIPSSRTRLGWWALTGSLAAIVAFTAFSLLGTFVFGLFLYYGMRPIDHRIEDVVESSDAAALLTVLLTALPFFLVGGYLVVMALGELLPHLRAYREFLAPYVDTHALFTHPFTTIVDIVRDPSKQAIENLFPLVLGYLGELANVLTNFFVAVLFAFYLLRDDHHIAAWFRHLVGGGDGSAAYGYATAVDRDLEAVYFSNVLLIALVAGLAVVVYHGYNYLAPAPVAIPFPTVLALLTGLTSLIPLVVGKVVYVPLVGYLVWAATRAGETLLVFPLVLLVVCFFVLDLVPMTFLLPEIAGRTTHVGLMMFGYVVGGVVFGWYGLFLGPLVIVLTIQVVRIAFRELLYGEPVSPAVRSAPAIGSDPAPGALAHPDERGEGGSGDGADGGSSDGDDEN
ncbi:AI-2E family transporter [Halospeciosus flavus]|uniref:AI-2E family transporter n=1 Tax=Halospeciosus flavus TaxID=3032283 RepID=A0ABD5Z8V2_9EURY|nr:AI-2E family transporter [Halospeciosus flavus]